MPLLIIIACIVISAYLSTKKEFDNYSKPHEGWIKNKGWFIKNGK